MERKRVIIICLIILVFIVSIVISLISYKDKYIIAFETGTDEGILNQYVKEDDKILEPTTPEKEGYVFIEWQLNGERYDFDKGVKEDTVLTAKWLKEDYITISYITNSIYTIESNKILKGSPISNLPIAYKDGYEFVGWSINGRLYNNEVINDDVVLNAEYKNEIVNTTYKEGDNVLITGNYSNTAYSIGAKYNRAIGWERQIIGIIENSNYPYIVGRGNDVTGFFKASSLEIIN